MWTLPAASSLKSFSTKKFILKKTSPWSTMARKEHNRYVHTDWKHQVSLSLNNCNFHKSLQALRKASVRSRNPSIGALRQGRLKAKSECLERVFYEVIFILFSLYVYATLNIFTPDICNSWIYMVALCIRSNRCSHSSCTKVQVKFEISNKLPPLGLRIKISTSLSRNLIVEMLKKTQTTSRKQKKQDFLSHDGTS